MKAIIKYFAERHILAVLLSLMILILGINRLIGIKRSIYPHADLGVMNILTHYPGASPEDVELNVTNIIEDAIEDIGGIDHITSISMEDISTIDIYINVDAKNKGKIKDKVRNAVNEISDLPAQIQGRPLVTEMNTAEIDVIEVGITGDAPYSQLRQFSKQIEKDLKNIPGVVKLDKFGYRAREIHVEVSPQKMNHYQISFQEIINAIQRRNIKGTLGRIRSHVEEKDISAKTHFENPEDVGNVIIRSSFNGPLIRINDIARIADTYEDETLLSRMKGKPAISFLVYLNENADVIRTCNSIKDYIIDAQKISSEGIFIDYVNDESRYVSKSFEIVLKNGLLGLGLVIIILPLFLSVRTAFWVALGIPISLLGTIFMLPFFGLHLDTIGLTGMILVLGIIVDDAIIISENITSHREAGMNALDAVVNGTHEVIFPVLTTVATTLVVFIPMFFLPGVMGASIIPIPVTIIIALLVSLLESSFALPAHLLPGIKKMRRNSHRNNSFNRLTILYEKIINKFLKLRYLVILIFIILFSLSSWVAIKHIKFILFPTNTAEHILISHELPVGTPLSVTSKETKQIEQIIENLPRDELDSYSTRIGLNPYISGMNGALSQNYAIVSLNLTPFTERMRDTNEIVAELRAETDRLNSGDINFTIVGTAPPVGKPVSLRIVGSNDSVRKTLTDAVVHFLNSLDGVKDITRDDKIGKEQIDIRLDYERLSRLGLSVQDVTDNVRIAYNGHVATTVRYGDEDVDFRVALDKKYQENYKNILNMSIPNNQGRLIPLKNVGKIHSRRGIANRKHYDGERSVTVEADIVQDRITAMEVTDALFSRFDLKNNFPGMDISIAGELFETERSMQALSRAFLIALIAIYFLLLLLFKNLTQPFLVMAAIPFGLMGVFIAFTIQNEPFSFVAIMGIIGLVGVIVNDSLVLVDHINALRIENSHMPIRAVIAKGTADRLRAVLLTSITTVIAIMPLAYGLGGTSPFMAPLALALGWGLISATPLSLILVPCFYLVREDLFRILSRITRRKTIIVDS